MKLAKYGMIKALKEIATEKLAGKVVDSRLAIRHTGFRDAIFLVGVIKGTHN